ncbi:MAG: imelysin family protein [Pseudomonadota bacterium]
MIRVLLCAVALAFPTSALAVSPLTEDEARRLQEGLSVTADEFILPAFASYAAAMGTLDATLSDYCAAEGPIAAAQDAYVDAFLAWQRASIIQVGPVGEAEGPLRVQLWPDPKGFSARALRSAIREADEALLAHGALEGRSIALTNLGALELLLFDELAAGSYSCNLAVAVASYQADLAENFASAWIPGSAFRKAYDTAYVGNELYPSVDALLRELLAGAVVYTDRLRKFKLVRALGTAPGEARAERTEAKLAGAGLQSIEVSFRALADFYDVAFGIFDTAPDIGGSMEYLVLTDTARSVADSLTLYEAPLTQIVEEDGASANEIRRYADLVLFHEVYLKSGFLSALGLVAGFTAADGD